jgi:nitroreductase
MDLLAAIQQRRSIRKYKKDAVPEQILREMLEAARFAPSWANTQVSRWIVVKDEAIKQALADTLTPTNPGRKAMIEAPYVLCLAAQKGVAGFYKNEAATDKGDWFMYDAGIAMEHLVLAATSFGLGTVHIGLFDAKKAEEVLKIPDGFAIVAMTPVGYFEELPAPRPRKPLKEIVFLNNFGEPYLT